MTFEKPLPSEKPFQSEKFRDLYDTVNKLKTFDERTRRQNIFLSGLFTGIAITAIAFFTYQYCIA